MSYMGLILNIAFHLFPTYISYAAHWVLKRKENTDKISLLALLIKFVKMIPVRQNVISVHSFYLPQNDFEQHIEKCTVNLRINASICENKQTYQMNNAQADKINLNIHIEHFIRNTTLYQEHYIFAFKIASILHEMDSTRCFKHFI